MIYVIVGVDLTPKDHTLNDVFVTAFCIGRHVEWWIGPSESETDVKEDISFSETIPDVTILQYDFHTVFYFLVTFSQFNIYYSSG